MLGKTRRFGMGDLMILIAALGAGIWGVKGVWLGLTEGTLKWWWAVTPTRLMASSMVAAFLMPMTVAALACRLRQPRPRWHRAAILPGTAALLACSLVFAVRAIEVGVAFRKPTVGSLDTQLGYQVRISHDSHLAFIKNTTNNGAIGSIEVGGCFSMIVASYLYPCGYAVAAVWLVLATSGRWRPEKSWVDRLGRTLGLLWILIAIATAIPA